MGRTSGQRRACAPRRLASMGFRLAGCQRRTVIDGLVLVDTDLDSIRDPDAAVAAGIVVRVECHYTEPDVYTDGRCAMRVASECNDRRR
jgi:hypothetical protein